MHFRSLFTAAWLVCAATLAWAHSFKLGEIDVGHPWARATAPGQPAGGGYLKLDNHGTSADRLLSAAAPAVAAATELHSMSMDGDVMRMRHVDAVDLPAGQTVELKPGGLHIMFSGLKAPLKAGDKFPLTLNFEKAGQVVVEVQVAAPAAAGAAASHAH